MITNYISYTAVLDFAESKGLNVDTEQNYKEARELYKDQLISDYSSSNNISCEDALAQLENILKEASIGAKEEALIEFFQKKENKIIRFQNLKVKAEKESEKFYSAASSISSYIPFGQPILVGHHSERKHRRDLNAIDTNMRNSIASSEKAQYYESRINSSSFNSAISSDNPEALELLRNKVKELTKEQENMKAVNKIVRNNKLTKEEKITRIQELGFSEKDTNYILTPNCMNDIGFPHYKLQNNNQNLSRYKKRLKEHEKISSTPTTALVVEGIKAIDNVEENRFQLFFPFVPDAIIRTKLKSNGFRWTPSKSCWQSYRGNKAKMISEQILNHYRKGE